MNKETCVIKKTLLDIKFKNFEKKTARYEEQRRTKYAIKKYVDLITK